MQQETHLPEDISGDSPLTVAELYEQYREKLRYYAESLTRDAARAEDLVQDTFIQAMMNLAVLSRINPYQRRAWLYEVLKHRFFDQQRAARRRQALLDQLADQIRFDLSGNVGVVLPYGLFDQVPDRYRDLLKQRYILGMSGDEIAREYGVPPATVRSRLRLAIEWLRKHQSEVL